MGTTVSWALVLQMLSVLVHGYDNVGFDGWYQPVPHRPVDIITDVINDLGVRILQQYTGHGNVAFSPAGVGFVLAALYEGSTGRGRQQIADALGLPRDRDITRLGFRDIHRRLRTYLNADGFLGGLTLNQENTRLRPEYEDILRFYGFDLTVPEEEANATTSTPDAMTDRPVTDAKALPPDEVATTQQPTQETTPAVELLAMTLMTDTSNKLTQTTSATTVLMDATEPATSASQSTPGPTSTMTPEIATTTAPVTLDASTAAATFPVTTIADSTTQAASTESVAPTSTSSATVPPSTLETSTATEGVTESATPGQTTMIQDADPDTTVPAPESTTVPTTAETTIAAMTTSVPAAESPTGAPEATGSTIPDTTPETSPSTGPPDENTVSTDVSNNQTVPGEMGSTDLPVTTPGETGSTGPAAAESSTVSDTMTRRKRAARSPRGFFSSYPDEGIWMQDLGIWKPYPPSLSEASVRDSTEISFLVNGCDVSSVTASRYFAVLPFAHFPSLHAVALEFPLDDPRYNILLVMSTDRRDTYRLARDLGGKSLRLLRKQLQATWVRATIPSFMLRGFVTLTSFLQRLGIVDVFEPRAADLSLMTPDLGVYARDVQQSIGVNIRNYMKPDRTHSRNGLFERAGPVLFTAVHPFLYFIVDAETSVALIAGRVNDPLNSRIL